jgi:vacuolar-type H+-ATPase subunit I/STV1
VSDRARSISDNVQFITQALRSDVERLNASVKALTARLHQASSRMEERIEEFNALMEVVQSEAEEVFLDTAATVRGVREGARAMGRRRERLAPDEALPEADLGEDVLLAEVEEPLEGGQALPAGER